jgi:hypothetical protein
VRGSGGAYMNNEITNADQLRDDRISDKAYSVKRAEGSDIDSPHVFHEGKKVKEYLETLYH